MPTRRHPGRSRPPSHAAERASTARTSDAAVERATGRSRPEWFGLLDDWGAAEHKHGETAAWLMEAHAVPGWWAQTLTVDYQRARGLRAHGGALDGTFTVSASKTVGAPSRTLFSAFVDARVRARWLPGVVMRERTSRAGRTARFDWTDGTSRLVVYVEPKGVRRSVVTVSHERLPNPQAAKRAQVYWRERMAVLKTLLER